MIILITGASHTGKTTLAQKLLEKYRYPYLSIDHLKMGLIRSGNTTLTPVSDDRLLTDYLWPIVREMIKTAIENHQNLVVEGCYIPLDWEKDFEKKYLDEIRFYCLIMSEKYIENHFDDIRRFANVIENRGEDEDCTLEMVRRDNGKMLEQCIRHGANYILIDEEYQVDIDLVEKLLNNLGKLHTTELGVVRIKRNLLLDTDDVVAWCKEKIESDDAIITRAGKNWYINIDNCRITVNAYSYTIITAHRERK